MKRRFRTAFGCVAALAMIVPTTAMARSSSETTTEVTVGNVTRWDAGGFWSNCDGGPNQQMCSTTSVGVWRVVQGGDDIGTHMLVMRSIYTKQDGVIISEEHWWGAGPANFTIDRRMDAATAHAAVTPVQCWDTEPSDDVPSTECADVSHDVSLAWTATGEVTSTRDWGAEYDGTYRHSGAVWSVQRPAVASGTFDGAGLGDDPHAKLMERRWRWVTLERGGAISGLGEPIGDPWFGPGVGHELRLVAGWDSCGDDPAPGDVCTATSITAHGRSISRDSDRLTLHREVYQVDDNGDRQSITTSEGYGPADVALDPSSRAGSVSGVLDVQQCTVAGEDGDAPPPSPDEPSPPPDGPTPVACRTVTHDVSTNWTATGKATRQGTSFDNDDTDARIRISVREFPAVATGTIDGDALGESSHAVIQTADYHSAPKEPAFWDDWLWRHNPDARTAAYANWSTCDKPPGPGDMCTDTTLLAYGFGPNAAEAELRFEQITYGEDVVFCVVAPTTPTLAAAELTVRTSLSSASLHATVDVDECFPPGPGETEWTCEVVPSEITIEWTAIEKALRSEFGWVRRATATGTMTGTQNPDDLGQIKTFGLIARKN